MRPKRSVTRFFIPLIDVLILLFCIFLLMPFMKQPGGAEIAVASGKGLTPDDLKLQVDRLTADLDVADKTIKRLRQEQTNPAERFSIFVLDTDPKDGRLFCFLNARRMEVSDQRTAQEVIDEYKRAIGAGKDPSFVILLPRVDSGFPSLPQLRKYKSWFKGERIRFDNPSGPLPAEFGN